MRRQGRVHPLALPAASVAAIEANLPLLAFAVAKELRS